jgi:hypothetical protein
MGSERPFADIELPDHNGIPRQLSQLVGGGPWVRDYDHPTRPTVDELHRDLRALTREVREDWTPPAP